MPARIDLDKRKQQLAEAVWATICQRGIGAVSVRTVAAEAGVAVGSLRHVFPTRSELLSFSAELMVRRVTERIYATQRTGEPIDDAVSLVRHVLPLDAESKVELEVNIALIAEAPAIPEIVPIRDEAYRGLRFLCERVVVLVSPGLSERAVLDEAKRLHALIDGLAIHVLIAPEDPSYPQWALAAVRKELVRISKLPN